MIQYGVIILAAGESGRLGKPKQLLPYHNKTLLRNIVDAALALDQSFTIVVTGAEKNAVEKELEDTRLIIHYNEDWQSGMASSILHGVRELMRLQPEVNACILTVCDQPFVTTEVLRGLVEKHEQKGKGIVASSYSGAAGTPVLFSSAYFDKLMNLKGQEGAKKLLNSYAGDVSLVPFDKGEIDIDTPDDYLKLKETDT